MNELVLQNKTDTKATKKDNLQTTSQSPDELLTMLADIIIERILEEHKDKNLPIKI